MSVANPDVDVTSGPETLKNQFDSAFEPETDSSPAVQLTTWTTVTTTTTTGTAD
ncbi:hypothetical protein [Natrinema longum]|uniref:Uncharacterized protein n=1 Tax=Natrinema longum TaxID=370324 RepID=A0A8A2UDE3_9EURY|nr:hypothetical protein [Natrinema longum]MBZ6496167.1 hypothetical protein [Natrinema longum]QSW85908.1 hypothetical protein J0X27_03475 [Natrinema longum]